ncbi:phage antirepressor KilAC domain-containing protein [Pediococcus pentosaceus]|uniref:phage antirepressor n=1 Tax=Pediococcus pentosaceus TaxID=1255 RepID=UPI00232BD348|nr:phage antirepressor KilAC domain-containing protein [Pediococcus pentosaceus]MDB1562639.1 phage antirepressor KilAC domain-containing protein [Pediococcus pentosaceus]
MNELQNFNFEGNEVRTVLINDEPYFVGKDIADVLGYLNTRDALSKHVDEEDKNSVAIHDGNKGNPNQVVINESGMYSLVLYYDQILSNKGVVTVTSIAKNYGMTAPELNKLLNQLGVQYSQSGSWYLYKKYQKNGYTHTIPVPYSHRDGRPDIKPQTKWTQKGHIFIYQLLKEHGILPMIEMKDESAV